MSRVIKIAIAASVLIFVAAFLFFYNKEGTTNVVVVQAQISEITEVSPEMITVKPMPVSAVPGDAVRSPDEVTGKMLLVGRMPGDLIPRSIVVSPEDVNLEEDEILLSLPISDIDRSVAQLYNKIVLALLPPNRLNAEPVLLDNVEIYQIKSTISPSSGRQQEYAVIKTTVEKARLIIPCIANNSYKILNNQGQPIEEQKSISPITDTMNGTKDDKSMP